MSWKPVYLPTEYCATCTTQVTVSATNYDIHTRITKYRHSHTSQLYTLYCTKGPPLVTKPCCRSVVVNTNIEWKILKLQHGWMEFKPAIQVVVTNNPLWEQIQFYIPPSYHKITWYYFMIMARSFYLNYINYIFNYFASGLLSTTAKFLLLCLRSISLNMEKIHIINMLLYIRTDDWNKLLPRKWKHWEHENIM